MESSIFSELYADEKLNGWIDQHCQRYFSDSQQDQEDYRQRIWEKVLLRNTTHEEILKHIIFNQAQELYRENAQRREREISLDAAYPMEDTRAYGQRRHDNIPISKENQMVADMVSIMQPSCTVDIYKGQVILNGDC